jgi:cell wall-associated NlpC family hydrolase
MVLPDRPLNCAEDWRLHGTRRRRVLASLLGMAAAFTVRTARAQMAPSDVPPAGPRNADYTSPYALRFTSDSSLLNAGFDQRPWNDPADESAEPVAAWQAAHARTSAGAWPRDAAWGPPAAQYPAPILPHIQAGTDEAYRRERVIAVAARQIGLAYQHHHIPFWTPPPGWAWTPVEAGSNGPGLDCSNFTSFVFNYALGIKLPTAVALQGEALTLMGPGGIGCLRAERIALHHYAALDTILAPADLIYIRNRNGAVGHVVMWLGEVGQSPDGEPLIIDCTETRHRDTNGVRIPPGVRLRPFRRGGWYWRNASHAHRVIGAGEPACRATPAPFPEGGDAG